jgi:hypothetical protein
MPNSTTPNPTSPRMARVHMFGHPSAPAPRTGWAQPARARTSTPGVPTASTPLPYPPTGLALAQGSGSNLTATWTAPATDSTHGAATGYNIRFRLSASGSWITNAQVSSPSTLTGLAIGTAYDVQVQTIAAAGVSTWSGTATLTTAAAGPFAPGVPAISSAAPPADGTATKLTVAWAAPATDGTHGAATGYNLRYSVSGAGSWTTVSGASSPATLTVLSGATGYDVQVQGTNAAASPGAWSASTTAATWGATVAPGNWVPSSSQTHGAAVAPNGGAQLVAVAAPASVTGGAFAWSSGNTVVPTSGLISGGADGQANGWGQWFNAPSTAGTYYLWLLAQGTGGVTTGALATGPITVT